MAATEAGVRGSAHTRAWRLGRALRRLGAAPGASLAVLVCDAHDEDRSVGVEAAQLLGIRPVVLDPGVPDYELALQLMPFYRALVLACADGVDAWRATGIRCRVIGDAPGVLWWRALELQARPRVRRRADRPTRIPSFDNQQEVVS